MYHLLESNKVLNEIFCGKGYYIDRLPVDELEVIQDLIFSQLLYRTSLIDSSTSSQLAGFSLDKYHEANVAHIHDVAWPKVARILTKQNAEILKSLSFYKKLENTLGNFLVTCEEAVGWDEFTWRVVRPNYISDIGDLHADKWFWDIEDRAIPDGYQRIKIWIGICCIANQNSLRMIPNSYKTDYKYDVVTKKGLKKPSFNETSLSEKALPLPISSGDFVLFHDNQLHGGSINVTDMTRVSLEWTMLVPTSL